MLAHPELTSDQIPDYANSHVEEIGNAIMIILKVYFYEEDDDGKYSVIDKNYYPFDSRLDAITYFQKNLDGKTIDGLGTARDYHIEEYHQMGSIYTNPSEYKNHP